MRKLTIQLVPRTAWYSNLRSLLANWGEVSAKVRAKGYCEICGKRTNELDAHEVWKYNDDYTQELEKIIAICKDCHLSTHIGFANTQGKLGKVLAHYIKVNGIDGREAGRDVRAAQEKWEERSKYDWKIDRNQIYAVVKQQLGIDCDVEAPVNGRYYARVVYEYKDEAKAMGAKWDASRKMWYFGSEKDRKDWLASPYGSL